MREGLRLLFDRQPDLEVVGVVATLEELANHDVIDVVVINAAVADLTALAAAIAGLRDRQPVARIVGIHNGLGPTAIERLRSAGLDAVVDGATGADGLLATVRDSAHFSGVVTSPTAVGAR